MPSPGLAAGLICIGVAVALTSLGLLLDWKGEIVYKSTTFLWYLVATALVIIGLVILGYHFSGVRVMVSRG